MDEKSSTYPEKKIKEGSIIQLNLLPPADLPVLKAEIEMDRIAYQKIVEYIGLPITTEELTAAFREITSLDEGSELQSKIEAEKDPVVKKNISDLNINIVENRDKWHALLRDMASRPDMSMREIEQAQISKNDEKYTIRDFVLKMLWYGAQKEEALQKIHELQDYHLPKTAALWSSIAIEVGQEYGEDILGRENINRYLYNGRIQRLYSRLLDPTRLSVRLRIEESVLRREVQAAKKTILQAQPAMDVELAKKGLDEAARKKIYGRAVVFLSEDPIGKKIASMVDKTAGSALGKSAGSVLSGMREGSVSPLCAVMLACSIDGAPDKEKAIIQYFTFLFAGQLAQEGAKPIGNWIVKFLEKMAPKGDAKIAKLGKWLMSDVPKSHFTVLVASVGIVCAVFGFKPVANGVNAVSEWIDRKVDHGVGREATANSIQILATAASWELYMGWQSVKEITGLNGVDPFRDQLEFLAAHPGKEGIEAWNKRVSEVQNGGITDSLSPKKGPVQIAILDQQKIASPESWSEQNIIPFQQQLSEFDITHSGLIESLRGLPMSPGNTQPLLGEEETLRYRDYALADEDIWNTRDYLAPDELLTPVVDIGTGYVRSVKNRLDQFNDKAIVWLEDVPNSPEKRLDDFFANIDDIIAREKAKCVRLASNSPRSRYVFDPEAYKKIEPWVNSIQEAKKQWTTMRALSLELAKRVTIARSLGVYNQKQWSQSFYEPESLAFQGFMDRIARDYQLQELTTPTDGVSAAYIIDAAGAGVRMYGDDILSSDWREKNSEEYDKWSEKNGFGIDDRHIHVDRVKQLVQEAYKVGVEKLYIQDILKPIGRIARQQSERSYITPDMVSEIEQKLGKHLLDKAFRDAIKSGVTLDTIKEVRYACPGYEFVRTFTIDRNIDNAVQGATKNSRMKMEDFIETTSLIGTSTGISQKMTSHKPLAEYSESLPRFIKKFQTIQNELLLEEQKFMKEYAMREIQNREKSLLREQKKLRKSDNEKNFQDYYDHPELSRASWTKVSENKIPLIYARLRGGEPMDALPEKGWTWKKPNSGDALVAAVYSGPGDSREATLSNLNELKSLDTNTQDVFRTVLTSGKLDNPILAMTRLLERSILVDTIGFHREKGMFGLHDTPVLGVETDYSADLATALQPYLEKASDKTAFLTRTLDELLKYNGISGENFDTIVRNITGK